jgi:hypothetical protein
MIQLKEDKMKSYLTDSADIRAMLRAIRRVPALIINEDTADGTIIVTHPNGNDVLRAIQKHAGGPWIVRRKTNLFS